MGDEEKDKWMQRVLGVSVATSTPSDQEKKVRFGGRKELIPRVMPKTGGIDLRKARRDVPLPIGVPPPPDEFKGKNGVKLLVSQKPDGRMVYTAPPPPVGEVTFSGGGAKGAALPGAVRALHESGVLKDAKKISGASVGSMTAALVAAGITADEFTEAGNADSTTDRVVEGTGGTKAGLLLRSLTERVAGKGGQPLSGKGLEDVVRDVLDETLRKRIGEYMQQCIDKNAPPAQAVLDVSKRLASNKSGPTFMDLRILSGFIPQVKEVVITGTYVTEFAEDDKGKLKELKGGNKEAQLYVFDADSEPDLEVAIAVHASASFPAAFKPINIELASGLTVKFIDGGVMNNTPTASSLDNRRDLDPVPPTRGISFVFEDEEGEAEKLTKGKVKPRHGRGLNKFLGAEHLAGEYSKDKDLSLRPEEVVVVPLKAKLPPKKKGGKQRKVDMRGLLNGTLGFTVDLESKLKLQELTHDVTSKQIEREKAPRTREFDSPSQMFVSIPLGELEILKDNGVKGATEALAFRQRVGELIKELQDAMKQARAKDQSPESLLDDTGVKAALDELQMLAKGKIDFQGYVARELNKDIQLDALLEAARKTGKVKGETLDAAHAVSDVLKVHDHAFNILRNLVYPKMSHEPEGGAGIATLLLMEEKLRASIRAKQVNEAIDIGVDHFKTKPDYRKQRGHKQFAKDLERRRMPV